MKCVQKRGKNHPSKEIEKINTYRKQYFRVKFIVNVYELQLPFWNRIFSQNDECFFRLGVHRDGLWITLYNNSVLISTHITVGLYIQPIILIDSYLSQLFCPYLLSDETQKAAWRITSTKLGVSAIRNMFIVWWTDYIRLKNKKNRPAMAFCNHQTSDEGGFFFFFMSAIKQPAVTHCSQFFMNFFFSINAFAIATYDEK